MKRAEVTSSNVASVGYDPDVSGQNGTGVVEVEFKSKRPGQPGAFYQYMNVPKLVFLGLVRAESPGSYLNAYIKRYPVRGPLSADELDPEAGLDPRDYGGREA